MCGIAGFAGWRHDRAEAGSILRTMCDAIRHRGPDDDGYYVGPGVGLAMRRLSIIDVAGGKQPIGNEDDSVQVVFNGEIYNHRRLRKRLEANRHTLATRSDTEVIVHLYEDFGTDFVHYLNGMFGIALWDTKRKCLVLARDRLGIKPLYYWETPDGIGFCSELRSLLALDRFPRTLNRQAIARYLSLGYVPDPLCVFEGVKKLPPGHFLTWSAKNGVEVKRYWTPVREENTNIDLNESISELQRLLETSVGSHLESEVPLGAFLSGGIDSSTVVAYMARQMDRPVQTFSIGFENAGYNEAPDAARVAEAIGTDHTEFILRPEADVLVNEIIQMFDEPFADSSALPTFLVSQMARRHVTVALSGDGGDELFGGYTRYAQAQNQTALKPAMLRQVLGSTARRLPHVTFGRNRMLDLSRDPRGRYAATVATPLSAGEGGIARADLAAEGGAFEEILQGLFDQAAGRDFPTQMMMVDIMSYLPGDILTKVDRTTMATSLEARVPLLDHELVEFAMSLPSSLKMRDGTGKWLLRRAIENVVPSFVLEKPKKGFSVPLGAWFRKDLRHRVDALLSPESAMYEYVEPEAVKRLAGEHRVGRRDHSSLIWRLMTLDLWLKALDAGELAKPSNGMPELAAAAV